MKDFPLKDARKRLLYSTGISPAFLEWDFFRVGSGNVPSYSIEMPEEVIDKILEWRDSEDELEKREGDKG